MNFPDLQDISVQMNILRYEGRKEGRIWIIPKKERPGIDPGFDCGNGRERKRVK